LKDLLIIDGYNYIFHFNRSKKLSSKELENLKDKLIVDLDDYYYQKDYEIVVVFDAEKGGRSGRGFTRQDNIRIIYSRGGETADTVIEELVSRWSPERRIVVVTSDYLQQKVVFGRNTTRRSSREFGLELDSVSRDVTEKIKDSRKKSGRGVYPLEKRLDSKTRKKIMDYREE